jgi:hypothetical protein
MTEEELRRLVRDAIRRHIGVGGHAAGGQAPSPAQDARSDPAWRSHPSFGKFLVLRNDETGACMIEPSVQCNHCGFCQSYGH